MKLKYFFEGRIRTFEFLITCKRGVQKDIKLMKQG